MAKKKILVCDDDSELRRVLVLMLRASYDILEASDGEQALRLIESQKLDLVLLDVSMPGMDGLEVLRRYGPTHPELATIILTGSTQMDTARRALSLGARSFVTKPFEPGQVEAEVSRILEPSARKPHDPSGRPWRVEKGGE